MRNKNNRPPNIPKRGSSPKIIIPPIVNSFPNKEKDLNASVSFIAFLFVSFSRINSILSFGEVSDLIHLAEIVWPLSRPFLAVSLTYTANVHFLSQ